jgi:hypothetical protein
VSVCVSPLSAFECLKQSLWNLLCISWHLNTSQRLSSYQFECPLSLLSNGSVNYIPSFMARQRIGNHVPAATYTSNNRRIVGHVVFYSVRVISENSLWVFLCITHPLLGKGSVNTLPWQRRIVRGVVSYAVPVISVNSRRLVLPRTSWFYNVASFLCKLTNDSWLQPHKHHFRRSSQFHMCSVSKCPLSSGGYTHKH